MRFFLLFCSILELFRQCDICSFSVRYWSCSDSAVFVVFLLDIGAVPTVRYLCFSVRYWSCSDSVVFVVFLLDIGAVLTVRYLLFLCEILELFRQCSICCFSVRYWSCSDSAVFVFFC